MKSSHFVFLIFFGREIIMKFPIWALTLVLFLGVVLPIHAISYSQSVLADNPLGYWQFEGTSTATDSTANARNGSYNNVSFTTGAFAGSQAAVFNGSSYVQLPGSWGGWSELTIEAWVNVSQTNQDIQAIVSSDSSGAFSHFQLPGNNVTYTDTGYVNLLNVSQSPTNIWRHLAIVIKSGASKFYVDGVVVNTSATTFNYINSSGNVTIGRGYSNGRYFIGSIDEVAIYNTALSSDRIQAHITAATNVPEPHALIFLALGILLVVFRIPLKKLS